jgi:Kef-type K+ transport system membrane component KefB
VLGLLSAAFTEWIGVHAIFGAFMAGVAVGDSKHLHRKTRATLDQFVSFIFAPVFFAGEGARHQGRAPRERREGLNGGQSR